jgi:retron-type reverse transcriptase
LFSQDRGPTDANWHPEEPVDEVKPFDIPKREVWLAFKKVKANKGGAGVDGQSIADFEADLSNNLYKLWNRLSSGSYFPPSRCAGGIQLTWRCDPPTHRVPAYG